MDILPWMCALCHCILTRIDRFRLRIDLRLWSRNEGKMKENTTSSMMTLGQVADHFSVQVWRVRRLYERGLLAEPVRFQGARVVMRDQLPVVEKALRAAGYLR